MAKKHIGTWYGVPIYEDYLPKGTRRSGQKLTKLKFIVAHDTGNPNSTAQNNVDYYKNSYNIDINQTASAHFFVDDKECVICIPFNEKAWHVLYNAPSDNKHYGIDANDGAIGGEASYFPNDKKKSLKSLDNFARVLAYIATQNKINYKTHMPGHQDIQSDKQDPGNLLQACGLGRSTSNLDKEVAKYYGGKSVASTASKKAEKAKPKKKAENKTSGGIKKMSATMTRTEFVKWLNSSIGRKYDFDGWFGMQCYDYANAGWAKLFPKTSLSGLYAKNIHTDNKEVLKGRATIHKNTPSFLAKSGDMVIFPGTFGQGAGHVAWVVSATLDSITVVEQNWLSGGYTSGPQKGGTGWETVTKRRHAYDANMIFVRPRFKANKVTAKVASVAKKATTKKTKWNWKGRFTPNTLIKVRRSPSLSGSVVHKNSWLKNKNDWVDFNQIIKANGYWWIRFKYPTNPSAGYFYCAICKITDPKQKVKNEKYWGSVRWK